MAFMKTSIAFEKPRPFTASTFTVGEKKDGQVWDGEKWVPEGEWEASQAKSEVTDG